MAKQTNVRSSKKFPITTILLVLVITGLAAFGGYYFYKYQDISDKYAQVTQSGEDAVKEIINKVGKLYSIPAYDQEKPSIPGLDVEGTYTIEEGNLETVKSTNVFYSDAEVGDILISYKDANISVLYRPSDDKIIKTGSYASAVFVPVEIAIIANVKKAAAIGDDLKERFPNVKYETVNPRTEITSGIVVDVSGKEAEPAKKLADILGYKVGELPAGETAPEGAKLIIIAPTTD